MAEATCKADALSSVLETYLKIKKKSTLALQTGYLFFGGGEWCWTISNGAQGLYLALCSKVNPASAHRLLGARDLNQQGQPHAKYLPIL